ncbi:MAG: ABC transporter permease [Bauldia sp.]|nr:ABC transporter permease [Bauldia sp.]
MSRTRAVLSNPLVLAALSVLALLGIGEILSPGFAQGNQVTRLLTVSALLGIVAAGQCLVVIGGREGIDLSVGAMISLGAVLAGNVMSGANGAIVPAFLVASGATFLIGIVNGLGVTLLRIPPLVMTLGMMGVVQGGLTVITRGIPSGNAAPALSSFVNQPFLLGLPGILYVWALVALVMWFLLRRTELGFAIYAIGSNERAAILAGLPVRLVRILLYGLSGFFAGITGVLVIGYTGNSFVSVGDQYVLPSVIAVVIGGVSLAGGTGNYFGAMLGAIALTLLTSVLTTLELEFWGRQLIFGSVLLLLMLLYGRSRQLRV